MTYLSLGDTQQDYLYAVNGITFQSERLPKAISAKGTKDNLDKIADFCNYSKKALDRCLQDLGIPERQLIGVEPTEALKKYIEAQLAAAEGNDWVMGLVAIIPCVVVSRKPDDVESKVSETYVHVVSVHYRHQHLPERKLQSET